MRTLLLVAILALCAAPAEAGRAAACQKRHSGSHKWVCAPFHDWRCRRAVHTDGCSAENGYLGKKVTKEYRKLFRRECEAHDVCIVFSPGRKACNLHFHSDMRAHCDSRYPRGEARLAANRAACLAMARVFYLNVEWSRTHGDAAAWDRGRAWRRKNCIRR